MLFATRVSSETYNVVNEETQSIIKDIAQRVIDGLSNGKTRLVFVNNANNTGGYVPDAKLQISASKLKALGWTSQYNLESFKQLQRHPNEQ